jgi:aspartyl/asparaginyl beta-hydroxylase (cupin superfamily)
MDQSRIEALAREGVAAFQRGDLNRARAAFEAVTASGTATAQAWLLLAQTCVAQADVPASHVALDKVLGHDPRNPYALLMKGDLANGAGDDRGAVSFYGMAIKAAAGFANLPPDLITRLDAARAAMAASQERFAEHLSRALGTGARPPRVAQAFDILLGRAQVFLQQPTSFYFPGLPNRYFYEREEFAWVGELEAQVPAIRAELDAILAQGEGRRPYVEPVPDRPNRGHALLDDPRWSAFHLIERGEPHPANAARCPATLAAIESLPMPRIAGRSPMALFSVLEPGTHIPAHTGMLNTRLICHLPLIVPERCRLRVGSDTRLVQAGRTMIFDDSVEHEAWNDGDSTRVVLLFEIWRPELDEEERSMLTALFNAIEDYPAR